MLITPPGLLTIARHLQPLAFDPDQFVRVSLLATTPIVLVARRDLPAADLRELVAYAREHPGKLMAANQGQGSSSHLTAEWLRVAAALDIAHVPFRGSVAALQGLTDGRVDLMFDNLGSSLAAIESGQVKVLAVASQVREPALPNVATVAELLPGFVSSTWVAVIAPPKTPRHIADRLSADFVEGVTQTDVAGRFRQDGCEPVGMTPEDTAAFRRAERNIPRSSRPGLQARLGLVRAWRTIGLPSSISLGLCLATFATTRAGFPRESIDCQFPGRVGTRMVARALSEYLTHKWGQLVTVDNIPSTGVIGAEALTGLEPDGSLRPGH